jgi:hypothetical protein
MRVPHPCHSLTVTRAGNHPGQGVVALAFLSVIPEGNLLRQPNKKSGQAKAQLRVPHPCHSLTVTRVGNHPGQGVVAFLSVIPEGNLL